MSATVAILTLGVGQALLLLQLRAVGDWSHHVAETVALCFATSIVYTVSAFLTHRFATHSRPLAVLALTGALVFRAILWPVFPTLTEDPYRYRWEGKLQAAGGNPYQVAPNDPHWAHLVDPTYAHVVAPDFKAVYGPLIQLVESLTYRVLRTRLNDPFAQVFWFKLPYALADLGCLAALLALLRAHRRPGGQLLWYAWCPLPLLEFWASGHNDSLLLLGLILSLWAAQRQHWTGSYAFLTLTAATKLWPAMLFLPWLATSRQWRPALISVPISLLLFVPYWSGIVENMRFASGFVGGWRNNDSLFGLILSVCGDLPTAKYMAFALLGVTVVGISLQRWPLERATAAVIAAVLLLSANCHPWYLTWFTPLLPFLASPALLVWIAVVPLAYVSVIRYALLGEWNGLSPLRWWQYAAVAVAWLLSDRNRATLLRACAPSSLSRPSE